MNETTRELALIEHRRALHMAGADDETVDGATADEAEEAYEWDDALCPVCGSMEACDCDRATTVEVVRAEFLAQLERDRAVRAENVARYPDATARRQLCQPCKKGEHIDHHRGVWRRFDGSSPVVCSCERCGDVGAQTSLL
jgi:hypothetical protein